MRALKVFIVVWLVFVIAPIAAFAFEAKEVVSPKGIKVWFVEDHTLPLIAMSYSMEGGASSDPADKDGLAYFLSTMLNEGAADMDGPTYQALLEELAIRESFDSSIDAFTGTLQTITDNKDEAARLLRLALLEPSFPNDAIERMRRQIQLGVKNDGADPSNIASDRFMALALPGHPYTRKTKGTEQSVASITRDDLISAHSRLIRRSGLTVSVVGDLTETELGTFVDMIFGDLPSPEPPQPAPHMILKEGPVTETIPFDNPQTMIIFGQQGIGIKDPAFYPAAVMSELLGGSSNLAWLKNEVREKRGLTYGISFDLNVMNHADMFIGGFSTINARVGEAVEVVKATIQRMADTGPTPQELADIKTYMTGSYPLRFDSADKIAGFLTGLQILGRPIDFANKRNSLIEAVTLEQVNEQAKRLLHAGKLVVVAVGKPEGLK
jgi:zinc protease